MQFKRVRVSGFDKLYNGYKACIEDNRSGFGDGLFTFLNHMMIAYELTELTSIELFYLKKFCSNVKVVNHTYENFVDKKDALDLNQKISSLMEVHTSIVNDSDIDKEECDPDNILPIGCHLYSVVATFKGSKIAAVTGSMIQTLFKTDGKFDDIYPGNLAIENRLASLFYSSFYTFISEQMTSIDIITEFATDKSYYKFADSLCSLAHINSPFGELSFYGNSQEGLAQQMTIIRNSMQTSPYNLYEMTYLTFCLRTTFQTFMKFYLYTPWIIDHEHLKLTFNNTEIFVDPSIMQKYSARIDNSFAYLNDFRKGLAKSSEVNLMKFNYIFGGNPITYSLQIPLQDIMDKNVNGSIIPSQNSEISKIFNDLNKFSQIAISVFN